MIFDFLHEKTRGGLIAIVILAALVGAGYFYRSSSLSNREGAERARFLEGCVEERPEGICQKMLNDFHRPCFTIGEQQEQGWSIGGGFNRDAYRGCLRYGPNQWRRRQQREKRRHRDERRKTGVPPRPGEI